MSYKLLLLPFIMTGSLGAMEFDAWSDNDDDTVSVASTTNSSSASMGDATVVTIANNSSNNAPQKTTTAKKGCYKLTNARALVGLMAVTSLAGLGTDLTTLIQTDNDSSTGLTRIAQTAPFTPIYNVNCDTRTIRCSIEDDARFDQICQTYNQRNATRGLSKRRGDGYSGCRGGGCGQVNYRMQNIPANCTQACESVQNGAVCDQEAIENGQVTITECQKEKNNKYKGTLISSMAFRAATASFALVFLMVEATGDL